MYRSHITVVSSFIRGEEECLKFVIKWNPDIDTFVLSFPSCPILETFVKTTKDDAPVTQGDLTHLAYLLSYLGSKSSLLQKLTISNLNEYRDDMIKDSDFLYVLKNVFLVKADFKKEYESKDAFLTVLVPYFYHEFKHIRDAILEERGINLDDDKDSEVGGQA